MKGIVIQLQEEALKDSTDIEELLRKAYLISKKLKLEDFEKWTCNELNGYNEPVPNYRRVAGEYRAFNPYRGWIPVVFQNSNSDGYNSMPLNNPIATIVDSYNNCDNSIQLSLPNELITYLNECTDSFDTTFVFSSSKSELKKIISSVRNKILEWALILEENGITGEGLSFSEEEKSIARTAEVINNYTNNFYGDANNTQVDQGTK